MDLTADVARRMLSYSDSTGIIVWLSGCQGVAPGTPAGSPARGGYLRIKIRKKYYLAHRVAWLLYFGEWPRGVIDHKNGDKADNRAENLRDVTAYENAQNTIGPNANSSSGLCGVYFYKKRGRWRSQIRAYGKRHDLGLFQTKEEAYAEYLNAKKRLHPACCRSL